MKILLYKVNPISGGEETELFVEISHGENYERHKFTVSAEMFFELGIPISFAGEKEISRETYCVMESFAQCHGAVKKGISILSFGDNTKKGLCRKIISKGFSREAAEYACDYLEEKGYINEEDSARLLACDMAAKKLYGPKRISRALYEKGFDRDVVEEVLDMCEVDFAEVCAKRIAKMGGKEIFADREEKQKAVAALLRYGFSYDEIKAALKKI
jgi:regulatory protein